MANAGGNAPKPPAKSALRKELRTFRNRRRDQPVNDLRVLRELASALSDRPTDAERIEEIIERAIAAEYGKETQVYDAVRLWIGFHDDTRHLDGSARHVPAWQRLSTGALSTFKSHWASRQHEALTSRLLQLGNQVRPEEPPDPPEPENGVSAPSWLGRVRHPQMSRLGGLALIAAAGAIALSALLLAPGDQVGDNAPTTQDLLAPANYPELLIGSGTETMNVRGSYLGEAFVGRSGLVIAHRYGDIDIKLFPHPVSCSKWFRGTPAGVAFEISVSADRETLSVVPVGRPLREYSLWWDTGRGNRSKSDGLEFVMDGLGEPGSVTLTSIDTNPGGIWRGRISVKPSRTAMGRRQFIDGTFAAQWCDISPRLDSVASSMAR